MVRNKKIETIGISYLTTFLNKNNRLQTYLDQNDKTPSWDGTIHVLKNPSEKKEDIIGVVPVQVKSTQQDKYPLNNYRIALSDLELYLRTGGVVLFVVSLDSNFELSGLYYKSLPPLTIKNIIKKSKPRRSKNKCQMNKTISVNIHPLRAEKVYSEMIDFIRVSDRQRSFIDKKLISLSELPPNKTLKFHHIGKRPFDIFDYQEEHDIFPYLEDADNGGLILIDSPIKVTDMFEETNLVFTIGESVVFDNVKRHRFSNGKVELQIGAGFTFYADEKESKFSFNFTRPNKLSEALKCIEALQELQKTGYVTLNGERIEFEKDNLTRLSSMSLTEQHSELLQITTFMRKMGIKKEVDLSLFDDQSKKNLFLLNKGLILKEKITLNCDESILLNWKVANVHIVTIYQLSEDKNGTMIDIFTETPWARRDEGEKSIDISIFDILDSKDWLEIDNCNFDSVINSYQRLADNNLKYTSADDTLVKIIAAADMAEDHSKKDLLLNWAQRLSDWNIIHFKHNDISIINDLQIKYRSRILNNDEIEKLNNIMINNHGNNEICFGVSVLLKSKLQAEFYWNRLPKEIQERYLHYPIYTLFKEL